MPTLDSRQGVTVLEYWKRQLSSAAAELLFVFRFSLTDRLAASWEQQATRRTLAHLRRGPANGGHPRMRPEPLRFLGQPCPKRPAFWDSLTVLPLKFRAGNFLLVACCYQEGPRPWVTGKAHGARNFEPPSFSLR